MVKCVVDKALALQKVKEAMEADKDLPLITKPEDVIPGDGNPDAEIVFIGEAGGYHESIQRKPFVGNAGALLNQVFRLIGIERKDVYITNMVKTRPPENRDPLPEELMAYGKYLDQELDIIQPKVIVTLGRFSMAKFFPYARISSVHGKPDVVDLNGRFVTVVPMYHPAAALRNGAVKAQFVEDFKKLPGILEQAGKVEKEKTEEEHDDVEQMKLI